MTSQQRSWFLTVGLVVVVCCSMGGVFGTVAATTGPHGQYQVTDTGNEPNDNRSTATRVDVAGEARVIDSISPQDDPVDWYSVHATRGEFIRISLALGDHPKVSLIAPDGSVVTSQPSGTKRVGAIGARIEQTGTYYTVGGK